MNSGISLKLLLQYTFKVWLFTFLVSPILMFGLMIIYQGLDSDLNTQLIVRWIGSLELIMILASLPLFVLNYFVSYRLMLQQFKENSIKFYTTTIVLVYTTLFLLLVYFFGGLNDDREFWLLSGYFLIPLMLVLPSGIFVFKIKG